MKDATDLERSSVSQTLEVYRKMWLVVGKKVTPKQTLAERDWLHVGGRPGVYVLAIARECPLGGPDAGMRPGAASEIGDAFGHFEQELDTDVEGLDGKRHESEFILTRVWSPEHRVQLAVRVEDRPTDGPGTRWRTCGRSTSALGKRSNGCSRITRSRPATGPESSQVTGDTRG